MSPKIIGMCISVVVLCDHSPGASPSQVSSQNHILGLSWNWEHFDLVLTQTQFIQVSARCWLQHLWMLFIVNDPGGCCTLVVVEETPPFQVKSFEYPEKHYVTNY